MSTYTDASIIVTPNAYKAGKLYSLKPTDGTGDLGVVRATTATYVDADGVIQTALANEPRLDYTNGSCPSILVEPQRTNLLTYSEDFSNASWGKQNVSITTNQALSPNGTLTADLLSGVSVAQTYINQNVPIVSGQTYTISIFAKKNQTNFLQIFGSASGFDLNTWANFDLENGTIGSKDASTIATITSYSNEWYKCTISNTTVSTTGGCFFVPVNSATASRNPSFNATNHSIYIWGAQLEAGANATSYIPTVASSVTRNSDVISKTGISDLINSSELTLFIDFDTNITNASSPIDMIILDDGTTSNYVSISIVSNYVYTKTSSGGVFRQILGAQTSPQRFKIAVKIKQNSFKFFRNGIKINEITDNNMPTGLNRIKLGEKADAFINTSLIFQNLLTDQECIDITTL